MKLNWHQDEAYLSLVADLLDTVEVQSLGNFVHHIYTNRLAHSLAVSYNSYRLAKFLGLDEKAVARAGLLHDLFFYDCKTMPYTSQAHNRLHPQIALANALKLTDLNEMEQDIILKHMCGACLVKPKYMESYIVSLVDKQVAIAEVSGAFSKQIWDNTKRRFTSKKKIVRTYQPSVDVPSLTGYTDNNI